MAYLYTCWYMEVWFILYNLQTQFIFFIQHHLRHSLPDGWETCITVPSFPLILSFCPGVGPPPIHFTGTFQNHKAFIYLNSISFDFLFEVVHWSWREQTDGIEMRWLEKHSSKIYIFITCRVKSRPRS